MTVGRHNLSPHQLLETQMRVLTLVCAALAGSLVLYAGITWYLLEQVGLQPVWNTMPLLVPGVVGLVALGPLCAAPYVSRLLLAQAPSAASTADPQAAFQVVMRATIVAFAMREAVGVLGFVLALVSGELIWCVALSGVALLAMLLGWPRRDQMEEVFRRAPHGPQAAVSVKAEQQTV
jgi:hypothetical protein